MELLDFKKNIFLYFLMLSFVFMSMTAFAISRTISDHQAVDLGLKSSLPVPALISNVAYPVVSAQAVLATDEDSGMTLYEKNPDSDFLPASTTKIITALVAMDYYQPGTTLKVIDPRIDGQKMGLTAGEVIKVDDLLYGLLVYSANDAAQVLADGYPGGRGAFIAAMNKKAEELSLKNTHFYNPTGLDGDGQVTTARDLARASEVAMKNPSFAKIVSTREIVVKSVDGTIVHKLTNINVLLGKEPGVIGIKTGWTENARENLVTYVVRDGHKVIIVMLGSQDRFAETKELIDWIFGSYEWKEVKYPK